MSTISSNVYGSSWYDQYKYASTIQSRRGKNSSTAQEINTNQVSPLQSLVDSGTITAAQEEAIKNAIRSAIQSSSLSRFKLQSDTASTDTTGTNTTTTDSNDPLTALVENGTITEEQKAAVKSYLENAKKSGHMPPPPPPQENMQSTMESSLDNLVSSGTISKDQKSAILKAIEEAFKNGTTQNSTSSSSTDPLDELVNAGTITKEQEASIKSAFEENIKANMMPPTPASKEDSTSFNSLLDSLVKDGTITDAQKSSILQQISAQTASEASSTDTSSSSSNQAYLNGLADLFNKFKVALNAYETQFEAGQVDNSTSTMEVTF